MLALLILLLSIPALPGIVWGIDRLTGGPPWTRRGRLTKHERCLRNISMLEADLGLAVPELLGIQIVPVVDISHLPLPHTFEEVEPWANAAMLELAELQSRIDLSRTSRPIRPRST